MNSVSQKVKVIAATLAALAVAPLVVWCCAVVLSQCGAVSSIIEKFINPTVVLPQDADDVAASRRAELFLGGIGIAVVVAIIVAWLLLWFSKRNRFFWVFSIALFIAAGIGYSWLAWDEPLLPQIDSVLLKPKAGLLRTPRELALEASNDPPYGRAKNWPTTLIVWEKDDPSPQWLHEHAAEIRAHWEQLTPVRDWVRRLNSYQGFDDYCDAFGSPIPAFNPLRQFARASWQMALLLAAEGHADEAVPLLTDLMVLGRKLGGGSRTLVTLMIGCVLEKGTVRTLDVITKHSELSADSRRTIVALLRQPTNEWDNLGRSLLNDAARVQNMLLGDSFPLSNTHFRGRYITMRPVLLLGYNRNATINWYRKEITICAQFAKSGDLAAMEEWEQNHARQKGHWHVKNPIGHDLNDQGMPGDLTQIAKWLQALREQRASLAMALDK